MKEVEKLTGGYTLLEVLICIFVGLIVLGGGVLSLSGLVRKEASLSLTARKLDSVIRTFQAGQSVIEALNTHPLQLIPIISSAPQTIFPGLHGARAPKAGSQSVTTIRLDPKFSLRVVRRDSETYRVCYSTDERPAPPLVRSLIALSADGLFEIKTRTAITLSTRACFDIQGAALSDSLWQTASKEADPYAIVLVPVTEQFTIYLDSSRQLRYLSHVGKTVIENQPLVAEIENLSFKLRNGSEPLTLEVTVTPTGGKEFSRAFYTGIDRQLGWSFMFNMYQGSVR